MTPDPQIPLCCPCGDRARPLPPRALSPLLPQPPPLAGTLRWTAGKNPGPRPPRLPRRLAAGRPPPPALSRAPASAARDRPLGPRLPGPAVGRVAPRLAAPAATASHTLNHPPQRCPPRRRPCRTSWPGWSSTGFLASTPTAPAAALWRSFLAGISQMPPVKVLQGPWCSATARTFQIAGCRRPRLSWRSPPGASSPPKPPRTAGAAMRMRARRAAASGAWFDAGDWARGA